MTYKIAPLQGKYYVTEIENPEGVVIAEVYAYPDGKPSWREYERYGVDFVPEDSHYETESVFRMAEAMVKGLNG